jgi:cyclophilin family peptidyl-prolyl cis-trans isomerase
MSRANPFRPVAALAIVLLVAACSSSGSGVPPVGSVPPTAAAGASLEHPGDATYPPGCPTSQPDPMAASDVKNVTIETPKGTIVIKVEGALSPIAAGNFLALVKCGYYDNVVVSRVVPNFVIQAGDGEFGRSPNVYPDLVGSGGPEYTIKDEPVQGTYTRGTVAMAKTSKPDSANSQFFIVLKDIAPADLALRYQIFGHVTSGMDAVDAIAAAADKEVPSNPIPMTRLTISNP